MSDKDVSRPGQKDSTDWAKPARPAEPVTTVEPKEK